MPIRCNIYRKANTVKRFETQEMPLATDLTLEISYQAQYDGLLAGSV